MTAVVMSGAPVADAVLAAVAEAVARLGAGGRTVGLGTILVGDDPASVHYVARNTKRASGTASAPWTSASLPRPSNGTCSKRSTS